MPAACPREVHAPRYSSHKRNDPAGKPRAFVTGQEVRGRLRGRGEAACSDPIHRVLLRKGGVSLSGDRMNAVAKDCVG